MLLLRTVAYFYFFFVIYFVSFLRIVSPPIFQFIAALK